MAMNLVKVGSAPAQKKPEELSWWEALSQGAANIPSSTAKYAGDIYTAVTNPVDTAKALGLSAAGGAQRAFEAVGGERLTGDIPDWEGTAAADAIGEFYKKRYGSVEGFKKAIAEDPVGVLGDASSVLGGAGLAAKAPGLAGKVASVAGKAANAIDPLMLAGKAASKAGGMAGSAAANVLGLTTGVGDVPIREAYRAGKAGGPAAEAFRRNIAGQVPYADVVDEAGAALGKVKQARQNAYQQGIATTRQAAGQLDFQPVQNALGDVIDSMYERGFAKSASSEPTLNQMLDIFQEFDQTPGLKDAMGFDALKQRIGDLWSASPEAKQPNRAVTAVQDAIRQQIVKQDPNYANTMKDYETASSLIDELQRELSLSRNAAESTTLRKLQSAVRGGASQGWKGREELMRTLMQESGNQTLMPAMAGQAMQSYVPRGIMGPLAGAGGIGAVMAGLTPAAIPALAMASPRAVANAAYYSGKAAAPVQAAGRAVAPAASAAYQATRPAQSPARAAVETGSIDERRRRAANKLKRITPGS
jgi:hypothetical protein